jgi:hypothetical protein
MRTALLVLARLLILTALVLVGVSGCGGGTPAGSGCTGSSTCGGGVCLQSQDFPGGYCSQGCQVSNPSSCPGGSVCIDDPSGAPADAGVTAVCYQSCTSNSDCTRAGFSCLEKAGHMVCRHGA